MISPSGFSPTSILLLGFGEAGSAIASGLCGDGGWREQDDARSLRVIDIACETGVRGEAMRGRAQQLGVELASGYVDHGDVDLVISVVTGEDAVAAARMAGPVLSAGTLYADFNSITGDQTREVAAQLRDAGIDFVDVAVMGSFHAAGHRTPLLLSGPRAEDMRHFAEATGTPARVLSDGIGDASAVKILRSVLMKGIEALSVECLVAARRQGLVDEVLDNISDVDDIGLAQFVRVLTITHLTHAERRMQEVEKAMQNLSQTGVPAMMSEATRRSHQRTVDARLDPGEVAGIELDEALAILDSQVLGSAEK